ncbi:MAG: putative ABC transporter permease [Clostridia bacterium]
MQDIDLGIYNYFDIFYYFVTFSVLGWILEVGYRYYHDKKFVNRGFLHGPFCPIYGFGFSLVFITASIFNLVNFDLTLQNVFALFLATTTITTILEFIVGFVLMALFNQRWWDYSSLDYNIGGYIALKFSIYWGIGGSFFYILLDKLELNRGVNLPRPLFDYFGIVILMIFAIDFTRSVDLALRLKNFTSDLTNATKQLRTKIENADIDLDFSRIRTLLQEGNLDELLDEISDDLANARKETRIVINRAINRYYELLNRNRIKPFRHFLQAFPNIKNLEDESIFNTLRKRLDLPIVKISISKRERQQVIQGNINDSDKVITSEFSKDAKELQLLSNREAWPNLSMKTITIKSNGFIDRKNHKNSHLYILIEGSCKIDCKDTPYLLNSDDYIYLPKSQPHKISNTSDSDCTLIDIIPNDKERTS